jgi:hypothetical protein
VTGGPCDQLFLTTTGSSPKQSFTLSGQTTSTLTFTPKLSGEYTIHLRITDVNGVVYECDFLVRIAAPGLRVELCWDRSGSSDLDLHLHRPGTTTQWFNATDDCSFQNCKASSTTSPNWGYPSSPVGNCAGGPEGSQWVQLGYCRNPRLDIDNISTPGVPEEIAIDTALDNQTFRTMVHYYGGSGATHPTVNVFCAGALRATYGAAPSVVPNFVTSGPSSGNIWRVADVTVQVDGGVMTGCFTTPLHPPGMSTGYWVDNTRSY